MKKFLMLLFATTMFAGVAQAQTTIKYQGEVDLGYSIGVGDFALHRINIHTIQGVKIGNYFSTGIGIGADMYHEGDFDVMLPIYLNLKGYLPMQSKATPFISMDLGAGVGVSDNVSGLSGFYCTPAIGVMVGKFKAQLGYNIQQLSESGVSISMGAVQIKVGIVF